MGKRALTVGGSDGDGAGLAPLKRSLDKLAFAPVDWEKMRNAAKVIDWRTVAREIVHRSIDRDFAAEAAE